MKERLQAIQEVTQTVQNAIGYVASLGEAVKKYVVLLRTIYTGELENLEVSVQIKANTVVFLFSLMNFTVPYLSYLAIIMLFGAMSVLYVIPLRYLLMAWGE